MARFCEICGTENGRSQFDAAEVGTTVMYLINDLYVFGFATVTNKTVVEDAVIVNGVVESSRMNWPKTSIEVVPYGCDMSNEASKFRLRICEFMIFSPDDEDIEEQMEYTKNRCIG